MNKSQHKHSKLFIVSGALCVIGLLYVLFPWIVPLILTGTSCSNPDWDGTTIPIPDQPTMRVTIGSGDSASGGCAVYGQVGQLYVDVESNTTISQGASPESAVATFSVHDNGCTGRDIQCKPIGSGLYAGLFSKERGRPMTSIDSVLIGSGYLVTASAEKYLDGSVRIIYFNSNGTEPGQKYVRVAQHGTTLEIVERGDIR